MYANSNASYDERHFVVFPADSVHLKKPSGGPKGLIGPPCHGALAAGGKRAMLFAGTGKLIKLFASLVFTAALFSINNCTDREQKPANLMEIHGSTMGTTYMVKIVKPEDEKFSSRDELRKRVTVDIENLLRKVNQQMSTWIEDSEISRFNRYKGSQWFEVSADTALVIGEALRVSKESNGAFDITVGPLINLWGFGPDGTVKQIPGEEQIKKVMVEIGYEKLSVRFSSPAIKKEEPGIYCDLSAIAKGFGVDQMAEYLDSRGFSHYLVEIGGEVRAKGFNHKNQIWRVAISSPDPLGGSPYQKIIRLKNASMATSGDYFNYFERDGVRYSHTIDPTTGKPIIHKLASVTVIHESCMTADAMATAINVLGPEKGYQLAIKENLAVFMIVRGRDGFLENMTSPFEKMMKR
jgi:thiamine biosynthesis lipoprotein